MSLVALFCLITLAAYVNSEDCTTVTCESTPYHYREFGCAPVVEPGKCCPSHFDCSALKNRDVTKCHFKNESIAVGKSLDHPDVQSSCTAACFCNEGNSGPKFICAHIDCAEFFSDDLPPGKKCIRQYKPNSCCSTGSVCGEDLNKLAKCEVDGKTYYEGEKIDTKRSCYSCICGKDYENKPFEENKHCERISCNLDLHYGENIENGCIPVYYKSDGCCPIDWRCPNDKTTVVPDTSRKIPNEDPLLKCTFGKLSMDVGDFLSPQDRDDQCTICSCKIPPFAHCIKTC